ncbi:GspE/PulE family protein [Garciella nitratireducens]|uniref:Type II secretion system protein E (GspE) n=1 Tax=Garciella nitratireducens DSM 15102 TaxID=1121911 RepID=A0A1T4K559_9FIRM|nr:GspE/PulE family protein [Garciella nitratireducens]SJZ37570.1 type II secretion system protein E (GspE) [Garciella nitratireducens DSM 15102]
MGPKKQIGDLLLEQGKITEGQLQKALNIQKRNKKALGMIFLEEDMIKEEDILQTLENYLKIPRLNLNRIFIDQKAVRMIPYILGKKHCAIPIYFKDEKNLVVAMNDPMDLMAKDDLELVTGKKVSPIIASRNEINDILEKYFNDEDVRRAAQEFKQDCFVGNEENSQEKVLNEINNAPVVRLVNSIIEQGIKSGASDIHIEPYEDRLRIRMRIDGVLREVMKIDKHTHDAIVNRIKIMANLDIAERRLPQDGAIIVDIDNRDIDLRISILPTIFGEKVVIRILDSIQFYKIKNQLGFTSQELNIVEKIIHNPSGLILMTGPTGSGKSSTLYTLLRELNTEVDNIITVEDPVEYKLNGINQVQVNPKIGLTFVTALRSILRQDPNIIMIGEIRDVETAKIAVRASITGHLIFSTIHTNDAASTITRLLEMGVPPYLISSSLTGIISQRLVRKICENCKKSYLASYAEKKILNTSLEEPVTLYKGEGCAMCNKTGYNGRLAIHEVLKIEKEHREMILKEVNTEQLRDFSIKRGMITLRENAIQLVKQGVTTIEEISKIIFL